MTSAPTCRVLESPIGAVARPDTFLILITAISALVSDPTRSAVKDALEPGSVTVIEAAEATTCALVSTTPSALNTIPVPAPCATLLKAS